MADQSKLLAKHSNKHFQNMQVKVTLPSENVEMKILLTKFDSALRAELDSSAVNYVMTFKFDKK